jgi:hypothetical protein
MPRRTDSHGVERSLAHRFSEFVKVIDDSTVKEAGFRFGACISGRSCVLGMAPSKKIFVTESHQFGAFWLTKIKASAKVQYRSDHCWTLDLRRGQTCHFLRPIKCPCLTILPKINAVTEPIVSVYARFEFTAIQYHPQGALVTTVVSEK